MELISYQVKMPNLTQMSINETLHNNTLCTMPASGVKRLLPSAVNDTRNLTMFLANHACRLQATAQKVYSLFEREFVSTILGKTEAK